MALRAELVDLIGGCVICLESSDQIDFGLSSQKGVFRLSARTALSLRVDLLPNKSRFVLVERNGVKVVEGTIQNLVASVEVQSALVECYLFPKAHAAL